MNTERTAHQIGCNYKEGHCSCNGTYRFIFSTDCSRKSEFEPLARADDTMWALPVEPPKAHRALQMPYLTHREKMMERQTIALERIADSLNNIQVMMLNGKDDGR